MTETGLEGGKPMTEPSGAAVTLRDAYQWAKAQLKDVQERPERAAEMLLCAAAGIRREDVYARPERPLTAEQWDRYRGWVQRHRAGEPIQYIVGHESFFGMSFVVNRHVLIPRPETELLVETVLKEIEADPSIGAGLSSNRPRRIADLGTGSGVIAITLARHLPQWEVWAVDCSAAALTVAQENARRLGAVGIRWLQGDFCQPLLDQGVRVDVVVSNPPYVARPELEQLAVGVRDYEPRLALDGGEEGLDAYRRIIGQLPAVLAPGGFVAFEVGMKQAEAVMGLLQAAGFHACRAEADLAGVLRFVLARFPDSEV